MLSSEQTMNLASLTGVTISRERGQWKLPRIKHIFFTEGYTELLQPQAKARERIEYLAKRRNDAHKYALKLFPETTHFLDVDTYYVDQWVEIKRLVNTYRGDILGGATWLKYRDLFHVLPYENHWAKYHFWDTWTTPEATNWQPDDATYGMTPNVQAVGGVAIYPREVFETNGFGTNRFPKGSEYNQLCAGYRTRIALNTCFIHPTPTNLAYSKQARVLAGKIIPDIPWIIRERILHQTEKRVWAAHEPEVQEIFRQLSGELFVDVGSQKGVYAKLGRKQFNKVVTIDPNPKWKADKQIALSNYNGEAVFNIGNNEGAADSLIENPSINGKVHQTSPGYRVQVRTFDSLGLDADLVKIDVEGSEFQVLEGINKYPPKNLIVELHDSQRAVELLTLMANKGYHAKGISMTHWWFYRHGFIEEARRRKTW